MPTHCGDDTCSSCVVAGDFTMFTPTNKDCVMDKLSI